ncbi:MAG: hypothetical protein CM15mP126_4850 [Gammaproteobacteria bacterium]|nr:MAG: hypothetical protein CM15mP126_4850 [Gammaproteobacteria bacterium]
MPIYYKAHLGGLFLYLYYKIYFMNKFAIIFLGLGLGLVISSKYIWTNIRSRKIFLVGYNQKIFR